MALTLGLIIPMMLTKPVMAQRISEDTLPQTVTTLRDRLNGFEDRIATAEGDLTSLTKIKFRAMSRLNGLIMNNPRITLIIILWSAVQG